jgi:hypothetical protein
MAIAPARPALDEYLASPTAYWGAKMRIAWLLKEVNDPGGAPSKLMGWVRGAIEEQRLGKGMKSTAGPIAKISYGLLRPDELWENWASDPRVYVGALGEIAWVNIKPTPGGSASVHAEIATAFAHSRDRLAQDLKFLKPNVIIGGNTLRFCTEWLRGWKPAPPSPEQYDSATIDGVIWVNANHPANRGKHSSHWSYFDRIREAVARQAR